MAGDLERWRGQVDSWMRATERELNGVREDVGSMRADVQARLDTLRHHMDLSLSSLRDGVREDLRQHMHEEKGELSSLNRFRWGMVGIVGFLSWAIGLGVGWLG